MASIRRGPLDDPVIRTWDALVSRSSEAAPVDSQAFAVLSSLHGVFHGPEADTAFLNRLETELFGTQSQNGAEATVSAASVAGPTRSPAGALPTVEPTRRLVRLIIDNLAIAAILAIVLGGLAVTFVSDRAEPEGAGPVPAIIDSREQLEQALNPPQLEALLDITIDSAALGGPSATSWEQLDFSLTHLEPGAEFSTEHPYYSCCPSLIVLQVMQGSAEFTTEGSASIYRMGSRDAEAAASGKVYELAPGDAVIFSTSSEATVRNTGAEELQMLNGRAIEFGEIRNFGLKPEGFRDSTYLWCKSLEPLQTDVIDFRFERVLLYPDATITVESRPNERLIGWYPETMAIPARFVNGDESAISQDDSGLQLGSQFTIHNYSAGLYTIFNVDDEPITLHFLHVIESADQPADADRTSESLDSTDDEQEALHLSGAESSLDITITPSELGAADPSSWDTAELVDVRIEPGTSFSTDNPWFQCCAGVAVYQVREGALELTVDGEADIYRSGSSVAERIESVSQTLGPGDSVVLASQTIATFANPSASDDLRLTHGMAYESSNLSRNAIPPDGFEKEMHLTDTEFDALPASAIDLSLETVDLAPGELTHIEVDPNQRVLGFYPEPDSMIRILEGSHDAIPENDRGTFLVRTFTMRVYDPGPYTLYNSSETPTTIHLMRMSPASSASTPVAESTPAAASASTETLVDLPIVPADLAAADASTWDTLMLEEVHVRAGESFTTEAPYFAAMDGIAIYYVQQGKLSLTVEGPLDIYRSGSGSQERPAPGTTVELLHGDRAAFSQQSIATLDNPGPDELVMLGGYAFDYTEISGSRTNPEGYGTPYYVAGELTTPFVGDVVGVTFERITLPPGATHPFEIDSNDRVAGFTNQFSSAPRWVTGMYESIPEGELGMIFSKIASDFPPGPYTIFNPHDQPLTLYLMRLDETGEAVPAAATPVASPVAKLQPQPIDSLLNIRVSPAELDAQTSDNWDVMEFSLVTVKSGESFTTDHPWFTCCDGMAVFQVREGSASVVVDGPADLHAAGSGQTPVRIPAATLFALESGETAVFAMESPAIVTNTGSDDLVMLGGYGYQFVGPMTTLVPDGYHNQPMTLDSNLDPIPAELLDVSFEQVTLEPGELTHIDSREEERVAGWFPETNTTVRMAMGELDAIPTDPLGSSMVQSFVMYNYAPGPYTFFNAGKNPATLTLMRIRPAAAQIAATASPVASPVAEVQTAETLLDIQVNPADLGAQTSDLWNTMEFELVYVEPGEGFNTDHPYFTCCAGITVFQILEGSASFIVDSEADVYAAGNWSAPTRIPAGTLFALGAGETAVFVMDQPAIVTNTGAEELVMLRGSGEQFIGPMTTLMPDGYRGGAWATDASMDPLPGDVVNVSFERVALEPGAMTHVESTADVRLVGLYPETDTAVRMLTGDFDAIPADNRGFLLQSIVMGNFSPGPYTFYNASENPATLYLMRIAPATNPPAATPVASPSPAASTETVVNAAFRPMAHSFGADPGWDQASLAESSLEPFASVSSTDPAFGCCNGVQVITVLEGELTVQMDLPMQVMMSNDPAGSMNPVVLGPGESALYESHMVATNTGSTSARFLHGGVYKAEPTTEASETSYGFFAGQRAVSAFAHDPADSMQSLDVDRVTIDPGQEIPLTITANDAFLLVSDGGTLTLRPASDTDPELSTNPLIITSSFSGEELEAGNYTLTNPSANPVTVYTLRIGPDFAPPVP
jgi:hypothetical protein